MAHDIQAVVSFRLAPPDQGNAGSWIHWPQPHQELYRRRRQQNHAQVFSCDHRLQHHHGCSLHSRCAFQIAPVRVTFVTLADTYGNRAGLTRIQGGESARGLIPLTRSVNEATVADMSATTPGLTINLPNSVHDDLIIRCTTFDPDGCVPEAKDEFPGVDYCPSLYHLLRDEPSPGIDITHDIIRALLPYRGIHMEVEPRILDGDVDIERL